MNKICYPAIFLLLFFFIQKLHAQVAISQTPVTPHASAVLDLVSTTKGMLVPRMPAASRLAIPSPANGLLLYDTDSAAFFFRKGFSWIRIADGHSAKQNIELNDYAITNNGSTPGIRIDDYGNVGINTAPNLAANLDVLNTTGTTGTVGQFRNTNSANNSAALLGSSTGTGPAIHALSGTGTTSTLALKIENGHFSTAQPSAPVVSIIPSAGVLAASASILFASTDVAGKISLTISSIDFNFPVTPCPLFSVTFAKAYASAPVVILTATNRPAADIPLYLLSVTTTGFSVYSSSSSNDVGTGIFTFNYFAIQVE